MNPSHRLIFSWMSQIAICKLLRFLGSGGLRAICFSYSSMFSQNGTLGGESEDLVSSVYKFVRIVKIGQNSKENALKIFFKDEKLIFFQNRSICFYMAPERSGSVPGVSKFVFHHIMASRSISKKILKIGFFDLQKTIFAFESLNQLFLAKCWAKISEEDKYPVQTLSRGWSMGQYLKLLGADCWDNPYFLQKMIFGTSNFSESSK